jgi:hypothetical protein
MVGHGDTDTRRQRRGQRHIDIDDFASSGSCTIMRAPQDPAGAEPPPPDPLAFAPASAHYGSKVPWIRRELDRGKTVLCEVLLISVMMVLVLGGIAGQYVVNRWDTTHAYRQSMAQQLLHETVEAVEALSFGDLGRLHGVVVSDTGNPQHSDFEVEITVTPSKDGKLCIKTSLRETRTLGLIDERVIYREPS